MRDPNRIKPFCNHLAEVWEARCPDWRFGQLVENVLRMNAEDISGLFFVEDDAMRKKIDRAFGLDTESEVADGQHQCG